MKEAMLYEKGKDGVAACSLCNHRCHIKPGKRGVCRVRENRDGTLYSLTYERPVSMAVDPIEKKPLFNFHPGTRVFSLATAGCNLTCSFCQNWTLSQADPGDIGSRQVTAEKVAELVESEGCAGIAYTYSEPTIFFEYAYDIARLVHEKGLYNVFVTNGYMTVDAVQAIAPYLDAANVDLKSIRPAFYKERCGAPKGPDAVLASIREMREHDVHVEVTNLVVPGLNDSDDDLRELCEAVAAIDAGIAIHFSRFHPDYKLRDRQATPSGTLERAQAIAKDAGLRYIYVGNVPGSDGENTYCPACGGLLIKRYGFTIISDAVSRTGVCPECGEAIEIMGERNG
ncbi:MAG: AmmeMemoRadiSam system radical SAM enzyme [Candidatus Undinarchaeales archaeon]|jgi:pyruvate formate lyase activating enzyme|nr:AmmeMemoRadiSam system radical SAM enzyme [Candidatus Undinarchaeales archaeon]MDP7492966.1 AmmeMemoRadiSam system radical SAM enzyme [Candidatus Undinarchaeales archaeon]